MCCHLNPRLHSLQNCEKQISVYKPLNLWYFVIAARTDKDTLEWNPLQHSLRPLGSPIHQPYCLFIIHPPLHVFLTQLRFYGQQCNQSFANTSKSSVPLLLYLPSTSPPVVNLQSELLQRNPSSLTSMEKNKQLC